MAFDFRVQAVPWGYDGLSFQVEGVELAHYNTGRTMWRPYLFPVIGPLGRMLTRMGHPYDPEGHRHHYSIWLAHNDINGYDFWSDEEDNKQVHNSFLELDDGPETARLTSEIIWWTGRKWPLLREQRTITVTYPANLPVPGQVVGPHGYWHLDITSQLQAITGPVALRSTPFGLLGVRMTKSISVDDGGGRIRNASGQENERAVFGQPSPWCDYTGRVSEGVWEGITIFDDPANFGYPAQWHVRDDGWMCPSQFRQRGMELQPEEGVTFRHRLLIHGEEFPPATIEAHYQSWVESLAREEGGLT